MNTHRLGKTILDYRKRNGMTIRAFSQASGVSTSLISQIERGQANPSLSVLELLAKALNVPLYTLFVSDLDFDTLISRKKDRKRVFRKDQNHIVTDILTPDFMKAHIQILSMDLNPHSKTTTSHYVHDQHEELALVLQGKVYVELEGEESLLEEGDVVRIPPNVRHRFLNRTDEGVQVLFVLVPAIV